jgi:hypothetical protein
MLKQILISATILTLALAGPVSAQRVELTSMPQAADQRVSGNVDNLDNSLLRSAADWISNIFGLPEMQSLPAIRRIPLEKSAFLSSTSIASDRLSDTAVMNYQRSPQEMVARYDDATKTIYLPVGWNGSTPGEMSVLVHLMAHHFQNMGGRKYFHCAEERKALPYEAQERWLGLYGSSLREDFGIDQAQLMLITQCMP